MCNVVTAVSAVRGGHTDERARIISCQVKTDIAIYLSVSEWDRALRFHQCAVTYVYKDNTSESRETTQKDEQLILTRAGSPRRQTSSTQSRPPDDDSNVASSLEIPTELMQLLGSTICPGQTSPTPKMSAVRYLRIDQGTGMAAQGF